MANPVLMLSTIGYEASNVDDFVATLQFSGIRKLIDIRELPISRRKGFAKKALSEALTNAGIEYIHLRGLGDPKEGRDAARAGDLARFRRVFNKHMKTAAAISDLKLASRYVADGGACIMCYERDHTTCHRAIVAQSLSAIMNVAVRHIGVKHGLGQTWTYNDRFEFGTQARP